MSFYSNYYKKYMFASADKDDGDNLAEFHASTESRNYFTPALVSGTDTFTFYSEYYHKYMFGSATKRGDSPANQVVELHSDSNDRTQWQVLPVKKDKYINLVRLRNTYYDTCLFASADLSDGDNVAELSNDKMSGSVNSDYDQRQDLQVIFGQPVGQQLTNLTFDIDAGKLVSLQPLVLTSNTVVNKDDTPVTKTSHFSYSVSQTTQWGESTTVALGVKTTIESGIPFIAEGKIEISASVTSTSNYGESTTTTKSFSEDIPITCPANSSVKVDMVCQQGKLDVPYTATVTMVFDDGTRTSFQIKDTFSGVSSYNVTTVFNKPVGLQ